MQIISDHLNAWGKHVPRIKLRVDRPTLAKRRWRGIAEDGSEFGFDLEHALEDGDVFFENSTTIYIIEQNPEPVFEVALDRPAAEAARLGWMIGNLHFPVAVADKVLLAVDDPAIRQLFERERIAFTPCARVFKPLSGGHSHEH